VFFPSRSVISFVICSTFYCSDLYYEIAFVGYLRSCLLLGVFFVLFSCLLLWNLVLILFLGSLEEDAIQASKLIQKSIPLIYRPYLFTTAPLSSL
jgi:hypothetical protein